MLLDFFQPIRDMVKNGISFDNLSVLLFGILIGALLSFLIYIIFLTTTIRKNEKRISKITIKIEDKEIINVLNNAKNQYMEESSSKTLGNKFNDTCVLSWQIINDIAHLYYPQSDHPIYELSIEEFIILFKYISDRIDSIFTGILLGKLKKVRVSAILKLIDMKKKYDDTKVVKIANQSKVPAFLKSVWAAMNVVNPIYWIKKLLIDTPYAAICNKIATTVLDVVTEETSKIYSKSVFKEDNEEQKAIENTISDMEKIIKKGDDENE